MNQIKQHSKPVWDRAVRLFHWSLVFAFITAYLSGEEEGIVHVYAGYFIIGLIAFRVVWGFIGTQHARFSDFIFSPRIVIAYAKDMLSGKAKHYQGHNPLGGVMVIALLVTLTMTSVTGLLVYGAEGHGPLANVDASYFISSANASSPNTERYEHDEDEQAEEMWEEIHEFFANLMLLLIALHIAGVIVSSKLHNENLVKAMITGYKQPLNSEKGDE